MSTENSGAPGIPRVLFLYWVLISGFFVAVGIGHVLITLPTLGAGYWLLPGPASTFLFYALLGWVVFYVVDTINLLRFNHIDELREWMEATLQTRGNSLLMFTAVYINLNIATIGLIGYFTTFATGSQLLGALVALLYPAIDIRLALSGRSPAYFILKFLLWILHQFGQARGVTADSVVRGFQNGPAY